MKADTIIAPHITEKSLAASTKGIYTFWVSIKASKDAIAKALATIFKVEVASVKTITRKGKVKIAGKKRVKKQQADRKIALVKLSRGKIDLFPTT